jgi:hypothetical protein
MLCSSCGARGAVWLWLQPSLKRPPKPQSTDPFPFVLGLQGIRYRERIVRLLRLGRGAWYVVGSVVPLRKTLPGLEPARCVARVPE